MIDPLQTLSFQPPDRNPDGGRAVLRMVSGDPERMAGSVPVWEKKPSAQNGIAQTLSEAARAQNENDSFSSALAYVENETSAAGAEDEFGFWDIVDMVNPLQHVPVVNYLYRDITGDEIKPASKIIGGSLFGGMAGGAGALANVIVEYETGRDITGNVVAMVATGEKPAFRSAAANPARAIETALSDVQDLPGTALAFADMGQAKKERAWQYVTGDPERMAGSIAVYNPRFLRDN